MHLYDSAVDHFIPNATSGQIADAMARRFYTQIIGVGHMTDYPSATFLSAGGYHHHVGMNSWMGAGAPPPPEGAARLISYEMILPSQPALTEVIDRLQAAEVPVVEQAEGWLVKDPSQNSILLKQVSAN